MRRRRIGCVFEASTDGYLVAWPAGQLSCCINQDGFAVAVATACKEHDLALAVDPRTLVGQAMGILMERYSIDGDRAFDVLKRYSQDTNTKLRDVAQQLIDTRKLPS